MAVLDEPDTLDTDDVPTIPSVDNSKGSSVEILDGASDTDICEETELTRFSRILDDAQKRALAENAKQNKRKTYSGRSQATTRRRKRYQSDLAAKGYLSVPDFMKRMESKKSNREELPFEESEESSDDDAAIVSQLQGNEPISSEGTDIDNLTLAVSEEGHYQVAGGHAAGEELPDPAVSTAHHQVTDGPAASEGRYGPGH
jgi:hypothetical protein